MNLVRFALICFVTAFPHPPATRPPLFNSPSSLSSGSINLNIPFQRHNVNLNASLDQTFGHMKTLMKPRYLLLLTFTLLHPFCIAGASSRGLTFYEVSQSGSVQGIVFLCSYPTLVFFNHSVPRLPWSNTRPSASYIQLCYFAEGITFTSSFDVSIPPQSTPSNHMFKQGHATSISYLSTT